MTVTNIDEMESMRSRVEEEIIEIDNQIQSCIRKIEETEKYLVTLMKSEENNDRFFSPRVDDSAFKNEVQLKNKEIDLLKTKILSLQANRLKLQEREQELDRIIVRERMNQLTLSIQERDRKKIAKRLDEDTFANLDQLKKLLSESEELLFIHPVKAKEYLMNAMSLLNTVTEKTKEILFDIHPSVFGYFDLQKALMDLPAKIIHLDNCQVDISIENVSCETFYVIMSIYYIVQECLNNINQHSSAKKVSVHTVYQDGHYLIDIKDDGVGFEYRASKLDNHSGLKLMKDRIAVLKGTLTIQTKVGEGTAIHVDIPIE